MMETNPVAEISGNYRPLIYPEMVETVGGVAPEERLR